MAQNITTATMANVGCITLVYDAIFEHRWHFCVLARPKRADSVRPEERRYGILEKRERCT